MTPSEYLETVLWKYFVQTGNGSPAWITGNAIAPVIKNWAGTQLRDLAFSGSSAKGTPVKGTTDVDLFISLKSDTLDSHTLKEVFDKLHVHFVANGYPAARKQNVSIHITHNGLDVDLVPAVHYGNASGDHWLYVNKSNKERIQTNIDKHISLVSSSGRIKEIKLAKIWRQNHGFDFPSFYLELAVIEALKYARADLAANFMGVLGYFANGFSTSRFVDPANTNNIISDTLTLNEKKAISAQASKSKNEQNWGQIVW